MKQRLDYIDQIKGIAIILVVIGHIIQFNFEKGHTNSVFMIIYSFHMPLFFFISGYIGFKTVKVDDFKSFKVALVKKMISLVIPLIIWSLLVDIFFFSSEWNSITINGMLNTLLNPNLWFLKVLFEIYVLYLFFTWVSSIYNKKNKLWLDLFFFIFVLIMASFYSYICNKGLFSTLFLSSSFFFLGVFISKYTFLKDIVMNQWVYAFCFILFIMLSGHWNFIGTTQDQILKVIISCFSCIVLLNITIRIKWNKSISNQIILFGQYSLSIYLLKFYLTSFSIDTSAIYVNEINSFLLFFVCLIFSIPICYISIGLAKIIELNKMLSFVFLGKRIK
jgi:fucose 4-O-acetylase-like acetyltransferase